MITPEEFILKDDASVPDKEYVRLSFSGSSAKNETKTSPWTSEGNGLIVTVGVRLLSR